MTDLLIPAAPDGEWPLYAEMAELARQLDRAINEMIEAQPAASEAAVRDLLWDNKIGILRSLQYLTSDNRRRAL